MIRSNPLSSIIGLKISGKLSFQLKATESTLTSESRLFPVLMFFESPINFLKFEAIFRYMLSLVISTDSGFMSTP